MKKRNSICECEHYSNIANVALTNNYYAYDCWSNVNKKNQGTKDKSSNDHPTNW
jgi:hypothetical protein